MRNARTENIECLVASGGIKADVSSLAFPSHKGQCPRVPCALYRRRSCAATLGQAGVRGRCTEEHLFTPRAPQNTRQTHQIRSAANHRLQPPRLVLSTSLGRRPQRSKRGAPTRSCMGGSVALDVKHRLIGRLSLGCLEWHLPVESFALRGARGRPWPCFDRMPSARTRGLAHRAQSGPEARVPASGGGRGNFSFSVISPF